MKKRSRNNLVGSVPVVKSPVFAHDAEEMGPDDLMATKKLKSSINEKELQLQSKQPHPEKNGDESTQFKISQTPSPDKEEADIATNAVMAVLPDDVREALEGVLQLRQRFDFGDTNRLDGSSTLHTPIPTPPPITDYTIEKPSTASRTCEEVESGKLPLNNNQTSCSNNTKEYDCNSATHHQSLKFNYQQEYSPSITESPPMKERALIQTPGFANQPNPNEIELDPPTFVEVMLSLAAQENLWLDDELPFIELASARVFNSKNAYMDRLDPPIEPKQLPVWRTALKLNIFKHLPYVLGLKPGEELSSICRDCLQTRSHIHGAGNKKFQSGILARTLEAAYWDGGRLSYATRLQWYAYPAPAVALAITLLHFCLLKPDDRDFMDDYNSGQSIYNTITSELNEYCIRNPKKFKSTMDLLWNIAEKTQQQGLTFQTVIQAPVTEARKEQMVLKAGSLTKSGRAVKRAEQAATRAEKKAAIAVAEAQVAATALERFSETPSSDSTLPIENGDFGDGGCSRGRKLTKHQPRDDGRMPSRRDFYTSVNTTTRSGRHAKRAIPQ